jgi:competence protein ComEC
MRRPALYALACFTCGVILGDLFDLPLRLLLSFLLLTLCFACIFLVKRDKISTSLFLAIALLLAGFYRHETATRRLPSNHVSNFLNPESTVLITGKVAREPDVREDKTFVTLETEALREGQRAHTVRGLIILKIKEPTFRFDYADRIKFRGYLMEPTSKRNPGAFDYRRYLNRKGIWGIVTLSRADQVEILAPAPRAFYQSRMVIPLRKWIKGVFDRTLSGDHKALLAGFFLGETREISKEVYTMFRDTGTVHLLAVSGSNVWLVVGVILGALSLLRVPKLPAIGIGLVSIMIFANLVNNDPPVVRAGVMAAVVLSGSVLYRQIDLINVVSFAGLVILACSPLFLFDVGFQLSFASVLGILILYPRLSRMVSRYVSRSNRKLWKWVMMPALISLSVELALFPILAHYFNIVPTVVVLANVLIVPLAGVSVVLACFTLLSAAFSMSLAGVLSAANWLSLDLTLKLTRFFAGLPVAKLSLPAPSLFTFALYYLSLWLLFGWIGSKKKTHLFSLLLLANLFMWGRAFSGVDPTLRISLLDVGSGNATVVEAPNRQTLVMNAGEKVKTLDAGEYIVLPFLNHRGIDRIHGLILTDKSSSNLNSALSVLQNRPVRKIIVPPGLPMGDGTCEDWASELKIECLALDSVSAIIDPGRQLGIHFLRYPVTGALGSNVNQMVTKIVYQDVSFCLFDGMKTARFSRGFDWSQVRDCSILVLPELGDNQDIRDIVSAVRPKKVIFTRHYFRYEKDKVPLLMALDFPDMEYYRTAQGGAIICQTQGRKIEVKTTLR